MAQYYNPLTGQMQDEPVAGTAPTPSPGGEAQSLVSTPAAVNLAAAPDLEKLSQLVNQINRQAQVSMIPGGEQMEQQSAQNIQNLLSGQLPTSFTQNLQSSLAQQYGGRGFAPDTGAMNAAALRAMGLQSQALQTQGEQELAAAYKRFPTYDISQSLLTPSLYTNYLNQKAQQAAEAQRLAENTRQFNEELGFKREESARAAAQARAQVEAQIEIAKMGQAQNQAELAEKMREYNLTHDSSVLAEINDLKEKTREFDADLAFRREQLAQQGSMATAGYQNQYAMAQLQSQTALQQATMQRDMAQADLNEKIREFNATRDTNVLMQVNQLKEQARQADMDVALKTQQLNSQVWNTALQYMSPFQAQFTAATTKGSLPQYVSTTAPSFTPPTFTMPQMIGGWQK